MIRLIYIHSDRYHIMEVVITKESLQPDWT